MFTDFSVCHIRLSSRCYIENNSCQGRKAVAETDWRYKNNINIQSLSIEALPDVYWHGSGMFFYMENNGDSLAVYGQL